MKHEIEMQVKSASFSFLSHKFALWLWVTICIILYGPQEEKNKTIMCQDPG